LYKDESMYSLIVVWLLPQSFCDETEKK
jgi:hypothetical protein